MNGKTPVYLILIAGAVLVAAVLWLQPYTSDFPGTDYAAPARQYLRAAIRRDSGGLEGMAATPAAVDWALQVGRTHPDSLAGWSGQTETFVTARRADTAEVLVFPVAGPCSEVPVVLRFTGSGSRARVVEAHS